MTTTTTTAPAANRRLISGRHLVAFAGRPGSGRTTAARIWREARNEALRDMGAKPQVELRGIDLSIQTLEGALDALDTIPSGGGAVIYDVETPEQADALRAVGATIFWVDAEQRDPEALEAEDFGPTVNLCSRPGEPGLYFEHIRKLAVSGLPVYGKGVAHSWKHYA